MEVEVLLVELVFIIGSGSSNREAVGCGILVFVRSKSWVVDNP